MYLCQSARLEMRCHGVTRPCDLKSVAHLLRLLWCLTVEDTLDSKSATNSLVFLKLLSENNGVVKLADYSFRRECFALYTFRRHFERARPLDFFVDGMAEGILSP